MPLTVDRYDLKCIEEDEAWSIALNVIPVVVVGDLLFLLIIQIHNNYIYLCLFRGLFL